MAVDITWEPHGVIRRFHGTLTVADLITAIDSVHHDARFYAMTYSINTLTEVTSLSVVASDVLNLILKTVRDNMTNGKVIRTAIVVDSPKFAKYVSFFTDPRYIPHETTVVETVEEARLWVEAT